MNWRNRANPMNWTIKMTLMFDVKLKIKQNGALHSPYNVCIVGAACNDVCVTLLINKST